MTAAIIDSKLQRCRPWAGHGAGPLLVLLLLLSRTAAERGVPTQQPPTLQTQAADGGSSSSGSRQLQQQQPAPPQLELELLVDDPEDDPFAGSRTGSLAALQRHRQSQQQQQQAVGPEGGQQLSSPQADAAALGGPGPHHHRQHHRQHITRSNGTHHWVWSARLGLELPQPWDTANLTVIVRDNLEPDLVFWQQLHRQPSVADILDMANSHPEISQLPNTRRLVELRGNVLRFPLMPPGARQYKCDVQCDPQLHSFVDAMHAAVHEYHLSLPDMLFIINTEDAAVCNEEQVMKGECLAPIISLSKSQGLADLVAPVMKHSDADVFLRQQPWDTKRDKAFFSWVARLAHTNHTNDLDAGIVERYDRPDQIRADPVLQDGHGLLPVLPRVPMQELPKYKWLLNLDGHVAAYRLAQLLATNSLVFKQESPNVEFYYKSLRPYHHFVPIFKHSHHDLMPRLSWARRHEPQVQHIIANANAFALRYTTYRARVLYWVYVLHAYRRLVPDMDDYFSQTAATGTQMEFLLKALATGQPQQQQQQQGQQEQQGQGQGLATGAATGTGAAGAQEAVTGAAAVLAGDAQEAAVSPGRPDSLAALAGDELLH